MICAGVSLQRAGDVIKEGHLVITNAFVGVNHLKQCVKVFLRSLRLACASICADNARRALARKDASLPQRARLQRRTFHRFAHGVLREP